MMLYISASVTDFLHTTDPSDFAIEQQPVSETAHPGASVTLACSVPTKICSGNHSVYWFRHGSAETHPGIIYTHGDRSAGCEKNPEAGSSTQSCVYHLPKRNLSTTDTGTYYCAVAACGRIIFGTGTELNIRDQPPQTLLNPIFLVSITANIILFIAIVPLLAGRFKSRLLAGSANETASSDQVEDTYIVNYAALKFSNKPLATRKVRRKENGEAAVYTKVTYKQQEEPY
ncbi:uncharacterized protein LOC114786785 [Denticeps clupeoides]|uniref:uncharacterized protein LOC114786785 n=1 Tax=Denticeps clupeoides TaxID=299321 RepID=UPI0010A31DA1|nr:uncharacterized protein LOC114786785 [Denticeps clupeoides]